MKGFEQLLRQNVENLFLVLRPPMGKRNLEDIDVSFGFIFSAEPEHLYIVSSSRGEIKTPSLAIEKTPAEILPWSDFYKNVFRWMNTEPAPEEMPLSKVEYYDVSSCSEFKNIVGSEVLSIEGISFHNSSLYFGTKINFDTDHIISTPIEEGNTTETLKFHNYNNLRKFEQIGKIAFQELVPSSQDLDIHLTE
ncbi:hypothetical protein LAG90_14495 [Marinilongibacter aquaticus]|uniref:hypothetical protein n=1 Tax=Marinilongibacter aquaticus TaxID=2975157 RepID=UPI0021BD57CD|nr:hypothetical protein [Marinilongibacter aquaticus]UBM58014.1 hypothetical protein LAG90_14495 [Marinilongibacter aquaticus]